jgi:hypothetical protein
MRYGVDPGLRLSALSGKTGGRIFFAIKPHSFSTDSGLTALPGIDIVAPMVA